MRSLTFNPRVKVNEGLSRINSYLPVPYSNRPSLVKVDLEAAVIDALILGRPSAGRDLRVRKSLNMYVAKNFGGFGTKFGAVQNSTSTRVIVQKN